MSPPARLAIVEDDPVLLDQLFWALKASFDVVKAQDAVSGLALTAENPDLFLLDLRLPPSNEPEEGLELIRSIQRSRPDATIIVMTGEEDRKVALRAIELGAFDFFRKPLDRGELMVILMRALERQRLVAENQALRNELLGSSTFHELVGSTDVMKELFRSVQKVAPSDATVLIQGESGTGKELVARSIHQGSSRKDGPFIPVNGAALQDTLAESELFGHEKGSFTGAVAAHTGKFELANRGTLFLDEIATLSPAVQAKLLRAIESREIERLGGRRMIPVDIRLISAANEDLASAVSEGRFREDLFYRINSVTLRIPPLRERTDDIPLLVDFFATRYARRHNRPRKRFSDSTMDLFRQHVWRGNVRELEHMVEMLTLMVEPREVRPEHLPPGVRRHDDADAALLNLPFSEAVAGFERELLTRAIEKAGGVKIQAARALGLDANQMKYLCRKHQLR